jgi:hypothetical protein
MTLGKIPRPTREEAEQAANYIFKRWSGLTGQPELPISDELKADVIQAIFLKVCTIIEERPEAGEAA